MRKSSLYFKKLNKKCILLNCSSHISPSNFKTKLLIFVVQSRNNRYASLHISMKRSYINYTLHQIMYSNYYPVLFIAGIGLEAPLRADIFDGCYTHAQNEWTNYINFKKQRNYIKQYTWNISKPAISRIPMKDAPCRLVRSRDLLMRWTIHLNMRSYTDLLIASTEYSTYEGNRYEAEDNHERTTNPSQEKFEEKISSFNTCTTYFLLTDALIDGSLLLTH